MIDAVSSVMAIYRSPSTKFGGPSIYTETLAFTQAGFGPLPVGRNGFNFYRRFRVSASTFVLAPAHL